MSLDERERITLLIMVGWGNNRRSHEESRTDRKSHSSIASLNPISALESVIELGGLPVKRQKLVNAVECI
ncbi:hypothetical protein J6590_072470 [Homalodisca vitripennis]|nr:hypothetical protein J6590_072470 [Homalodisca vitripennis]